jgi:hypothetical protein
MNFVKFPRRADIFRRIFIRCPVFFSISIDGNRQQRDYRLLTM